MTQRVVSEMFQFKCIDFLLEDVFLSKSSSMGVNLPLEVIFRWRLSIIGVYLGPSEVRALPLAAGINVSGHYF